MKKYKLKYVKRRISLYIIKKLLLKHRIKVKTNMWVIEKESKTLKKYRLKPIDLLIGGNKLRKFLNDELKLVYLAIQKVKYKYCIYRIG